MHDGALLSWKWLSTCLLMRSSELIPSFALLVHTALLYILGCLYLSPWVFSLSPFQIFFPIPLGRSERAAGWGWAAYWSSPTTMEKCSKYLLLLRRNYQRNKKVHC